MQPVLMDGEILGGEFERQVEMDQGFIDSFGLVAFLQRAVGCVGFNQDDFVAAEGYIGQALLRLDLFGQDCGTGIAGAKLLCGLGVFLFQQFWPIGETA